MDPICDAPEHAGQAGRHGTGARAGEGEIEREECIEF